MFWDTMIGLGVLWAIAIAVEAAWNWNSEEQSLPEGPVEPQESPPA